jgi:hypothetical protein
MTDGFEGVLSVIWAFLRTGDGFDGELKVKVDIYEYVRKKV